MTDTAPPKRQQQSEADKRKEKKLQDDVHASLAVMFVVGLSVKRVN